MPEYAFKCKECGTRKAEFVHRYDDLVVPLCLVCDNDMVRDFSNFQFHTPKDSYDRPIHSDALAISVDQKEEHERNFPDIKLEKVPGGYRPIFDKYNTHEDYLNRTGFVKHPGKQKRKATRIS